MELIPIIKGAATYVPGLFTLLSKHRTGGTDRAAYCYSVWLKHLCMAWQHRQEIPRVVAELGPGDSLGIGLAAVLCGAETYMACDVVRFADTARNLAVLDELVQLFQRREPVPIGGWPDFSGSLHNGFPSSILGDLDLSGVRVEAIKHSLRIGNGVVSYHVPWDRMEPVVKIDHLFSHSTLEHVTDPAQVYRACARWVRPEGLMTHQIDFTSHSVTRDWNGHWQYPDWIWRIVHGTRPFLINRMPPSEHVRLIRDSGFDILTDLRHLREGGLSRDTLAPEWRSLSDEDLRTDELFVCATL